MLAIVSKARTTKGFTLVELLVASVVALTVLGIALGMLVEQRRWILGDRTRATANDNLRLTSDFIGQDIKQAGQLLNGNTQLPGISIVPGSSPSVPDTLVLQRQLSAATLPVCQSIAAGSSTNTIAVSVMNGTINGTNYGSAVSNCTYSYTLPTGGELSTTLSTLLPTDNLRAWRTYRCTQSAPAANGVDPCASTNSATAWAYIYQPPATAGGTGYGEFFQYTGEYGPVSCNSSTGFPTPPSPRTCQGITLVRTTPWQFSYTYSPSGAASAQPQLYLLEERTYSAIPDPSTPNSYILQLSINRQTPLRIANNLSNFQVWAKVPTSYSAANGSSWQCAASGSAATAPNPSLPNQWYCGAFNVDLTKTYSPTVLAQQYINNWQDLMGVRIQLTGINPNSNLLKVDTTQTNNDLTLSSEFYPRNVASQSN